MSSRRLRVKGRNSIFIDVLDYDRPEEQLLYGTPAALVHLLFRPNLCVMKDNPSTLVGILSHFGGFQAFYSYSCSE